MQLVSCKLTHFLVSWRENTDINFLEKICHSHYLMQQFCNFHYNCEVQPLQRGLEVSTLSLHKQIAHKLYWTERRRERGRGIEGRAARILCIQQRRHPPHTLQPHSEVILIDSNSRLLPDSKLFPRLNSIKKGRTLGPQCCQIQHHYYPRSQKV